MTSPYVGPGYSWSDQMAKKVPKQTDLLDQTLGQRFGAGNGAQPPSSPMSSPPAQPAAPVAGTAPAAPGTPPGSTPLAGTSTPSYVNPFRANAAAPAPPTAQPPAPMVAPPETAVPVHGTMANTQTTATPPATPAAPPPAPPVPSPVASNAGHSAADTAAAQAAFLHPPTAAADPFAGQAAGTPATPPQGAPVIPASALSPMAQGWHTDLGYYVDAQGRTFDTTTHQQLPGSVIQDRNAMGPTAGTTPPIAPPSGIPAPTPITGTKENPLTPPVTGTTGLVDKATTAAGTALDNPNPYDDALIRRLWDEQAGNIDSQYDTANQGLQGNLASRGITDSTFGGQKEQQLEGQRRTAKETALTSLMSHAADVNSQSRTQAILNAMGIDSSEWNKLMDVNQSDQNSQQAYQQFLEWLYSQGKS